MDRRALCILLSGLGIIWACNDHDPHPANLDESAGTPALGGGGGGGGSSGTDGGTITDAAAGLDADANRECTDLDDPTVSIDENSVSDTAPAGLGGPLGDGVYDLTTAQKYVGASGQAGPNGLVYREIIRITGGTSLERNRTAQQGAGPVQATNSSYVLQISGTNLTLTQKCPTSGAGEVFAFTSDNGKLTLISVTGESFTYTVRP